MPKPQHKFKVSWIRTVELLLLIALPLGVDLAKPYPLMFMNKIKKPMFHWLLLMLTKLQICPLLIASPQCQLSLLFKVLGTTSLKKLLVEANLMSIKHSQRLSHPNDFPRGSTNDLIQCIYTQEIQINLFYEK